MRLGDRSGRNDVVLRSQLPSQRHFSQFIEAQVATKFARLCRNRLEVTDKG
jgi:hypothetical protein